VSFDIFLERLAAGDSVPADRSNVLKVLRKHCQDSGNAFGFYNVEFSDGSHVEFSAKHLESDGAFTGCAFHLRGFTPLIIAFVFEVAVAGDMIIFNAQGRDTPDEPLAILVNQSQLTQLPTAAASHPVFCSSPYRLAELLGIGIEKWTEFRDTAIGKQSDS
jgi:hypothetical protein